MPSQNSPKPRQLQLPLPPPAVRVEGSPCDVIRTLEGLLGDCWAFTHMSLAAAADAWGLAEAARRFRFDVVCTVPRHPGIFGLSLGHRISRPTRYLEDGAELFWIRPTTVCKAVLGLSAGPHGLAMVLGEGRRWRHIDLGAREAAA